MMPESLGVIISTYNNPVDLELVVRSYEYQTDKNFSLYIADDGSGIETSQCISHLKQVMPFPIHHIRHEDDGFRLAEIRNRCIAASSEPYLLITDGDCLAPPNLVATHRRLARKGSFVSGSRILLEKKISASLRRGEMSLESLFRPATLARWRLARQLNRFWPSVIPPFPTPANRKLNGLRGCHMAFWRQDLLRVNGYDQGYRGWGREDTDLAARLFHAGLRRRSLIGAALLHLWHPEAERSSLPVNDERLAACLREQRQRAPIGIEELQ